MLSHNLPTPKTFRPLAASVSLFALLAAAAPVMAQEAPPAPPAEQQQQAPAPQVATISRIKVEGNERIDAATVISYLPIQVGQTVNDALIDQSVKTLFRTELFSDVQIVMNGQEMVVSVVEAPIINQVVFEGNSALSKDKLRDEVTIRPRGVFTKAKVQADVQRIIELYRRSGRISATVTPKIVELPQKRVDLIFEINEGVKTGVENVNFVGNKAYSDNELAGVVVTRKSLWWKFFSSNDNYDPDRMDYDREQLKKHYTNRGYYDFRVVSAVAELTPDRKDFVITYTLDEGQKYNFGRVTVKTENDKLNGENLARILPIQPGQLYEADLIEKSVDTLTYAAGQAGFAFVDVRPRDEGNAESKTVDVTFNVREGARVYIDKIDVVGNARTLDRVVRREMLVSEGDAYNKALIERSKMFVNALGFFKEADIKETPGSAPDRTNIRVEVTEQPTGELSFGAGFSSYEKFILDVGITERNFRGRGQNVRARVSLGSIQKNVDLSFTEPHFMGRDISAGIDIFSSSYEYEGVSYSTKTNGAGLRLGYSLNGYSILRLRYNLRNDELSTTTSSACDDLLYSCGNGVTSSVGYTLSFDRRNDYVMATRGWQTILRQDFAGLGGDSKYIRSELEAHWYHGFRKDMILHVQGLAGNITPTNGDSIRINDRFFKGGTTFRGFENAGIGPRDTSSTYSLGGETYAIGTVELGIPNGLPEQYGLKTALFVDFGTMGGVDDRLKYCSATQAAAGSCVAGARLDYIKDDFSLRAAAGITIRWKSPMGPIQFDISQLLKREDYDKTETFRFSQSTQF
ncbi:outer membrane protein assembly factor BamA [Asticcacaulis sp. YBE204]|uniref:outer membrane protein assembly factor BamA n=1 Tax=Asticcacaulis sp. YBE204 TaxID=1282363 RepID=UPI0003C3D36F|nr:outer membrane protein assembly factor BamA [Asticcacaulis sp. YBE204]ESQ78145.1 outer membrane protein assembly complex, YaeT protein [Asticcacaulis sp. YBE204]